MPEVRWPLEPMEAATADDLPEGPDWEYEPKWDGFRCLIFRDGERIRLQSKAKRPLARYFPDVVDRLRVLPARRFVLDGELVIPVGNTLSFDELLLRIHPAASRVAELAAGHPATFIAFDLLADPEHGSLLERPLRERRPQLELFARRQFGAIGGFRLSPATRRLATARRWLSGGRDGLDGIMAKRLDQPYRPGSRDAMIKVKRLRTADCVVGGFRYASSGHVVGSLLLGLYDEAGALHHVGFTSGLSAAERRELAPRLEALEQPPGFTGRAPGGPSRWSRGRSTDWTPLAPQLVCEVQYDHVSGGRFRHGTRLLRWRPDKAPRQCTLDQIRPAGESALRLLRSSPSRRKGRT